MRPKISQDIMILTKNVPGPEFKEQIPKDNILFLNFPIVVLLFLIPLDLKDLTINNVNKKILLIPDSNDVPGPGNYKLDNVGIQKTGFYPISNLHSSQCRSFPHDIRKTYSVLSMQTLGPGQYRLPSKFGYYESKSATRN